MMKLNSQQDIVKAVRQAGVIGAGGAGFPTHVKLGAKVDTVIANGSECEPLLATDKETMKANPALLVEGVRIAMRATGASRGIVAVKGRYEDVVGSLKGALPADGSIELFLMDNYYPAGDEFLLVYDVAGRIIPEGGIPLNVGVVVDNVVTLMQIARAIHGVPVTSRAVTIAGEVARPCVVNAPIGTTYGALLESAGGATVCDPAVIDGGPMMGKIVDDVDAGMAKTTSGIVVLPRGHFVVRMKGRSIGREVKLAKAACCQCFRCTDLCPRNLLGHNLYPHMTMRTMNCATDTADHVTSAFLCSQCGVCDMVACDFMRLSPKRVYAHIKERLIASGMKSPHRREKFPSRESYGYRKFPIPQLLKKLDIERYYRRLELVGDVKPKLVRVPITKHTGAPAVAQVKVGDAVKMTDIIAETPEDKLGARYHASISGRVTVVDKGYVEITA